MLAWKSSQKLTALILLPAQALLILSLWVHVCMCILLQEDPPRGRDRTKIGTAHDNRERAAEKRKDTGLLVSQPSSVSKVREKTCSAREIFQKG